MNSKQLTIAIVGNSPSLLEHEYGYEIDSHNIIVRFNNFVLEGYEKQLGKKYTHIFLMPTCVNDQYRIRYVNIDKMINIPKENRLVKQVHYVSIPTIMNGKLTDDDVTFIDENIEKGMKQKMQANGYSSGMIALQMFSDTYPDAIIDAYGFSFLKDEKLHSYDNVKCNWETPDKEEEYFNTYLKDKVHLHI